MFTGSSRAVFVPGRGRKNSPGKDSMTGWILPTDVDHGEREIGAQAGNLAETFEMPAFDMSFSSFFSLAYPLLKNELAQTY
jgi:hypothetical protein